MPVPESSRASSHAGSAGEPRYPAPITPRSGGKKQLERLLDVLGRRGWIVLLCLVVAGIIGAYHSFTQAPVYQTGAVVMLDITRMPGGQSQEVIGNTPFVRSERSQATEIFILQNSYDIARRVNERLRQMEAEGAAITLPLQGGVRFESASRTIASAIRVTATSPNPTEAAILANVYAEEYVRQTQDASRQHLAASRAFLEEQEARRSAELQRAEEALQQYQQQAGAIALSREGAQIVGRMVNLETQRDEALIELQMRQAQMSTLEQEIAEVSPNLPHRVVSEHDRRMAVLRDELNQLEARRADIRAWEDGQDGDAAAREDLRRIERRIANVQAEMHELSAGFLDEVISVGGVGGPEAAVSRFAELERRGVDQRIALEGLQARVNTMNQRLGQYQSQIGAIPELSTDLARLERDRQLAEQMYRYVVQRLQDTRIHEESEPGYARILRHAGVPSVPAGHGKWRPVGVALLLGLLIGIALAIGRDRLDTRIYKVEQLRERGLPVLGMVPNLAPHLKEAHHGADTAEREGLRVATSLVTLLDPLSPPSETFRHLRTTLQFSRLDRVVGKIVVSSPGQGDGKTTTASNVAVTMAQSHRRTLLIDADLRLPRVHELFGIENRDGLSHLLASGLDFDAATLGRWIERHRSPLHPNLFVLPAGAFQPSDEANPAELLGSKRMRELLAAFSEMFDVVVLDTPPVLAATDAVLLSTQADAVVLVVRAAGTKEGDLEHAIEMLDDVGAPLAGMLLNGFDLSMAYGYRYSYGHYSKYGPYSRYGQLQDDEA